VREWIFETQRSRTGTDADWISDNADTVDTAHLALRGRLSDALDWSLGASYSTATGTVHTRNAGPVAGGPTPTAGNAKRFPAFVDSLLRLDAALRYRFRDNWTASLGYVYETFGQHDWRSDTVNPFVPAVGSSIFLGHQPHGYDAHVIAMTLGYRFR
jgi:Putative outer membrane beta-barrel porin, MtrB/PioB